MSPFDEFMEQLRAGDWDLRLDELSEAMQARYRVIEATKSAELTTGSRVMVPYDQNPKYMRGQIGQVVGFTSNGKPRVDFPSAPRGRNGVWTWPASALLKADE